LAKAPEGGAKGLPQGSRAEDQGLSSSHHRIQLSGDEAEQTLVEGVEEHPRRGITPSRTKRFCEDLVAKS
jgi:phage gp29-like protein